MVCYVLLITGWSSLRQLLPLRIAQVAAVGVALRVDHVWLRINVNYLLGLPTGLDLPRLHLTTLTLPFLEKMQLRSVEWMGSVLGDGWLVVHHIISFTLLVGNWLVHSYLRLLAVVRFQVYINIINLRVNFCLNILTFKVVHLTQTVGVLILIIGNNVVVFVIILAVGSLTLLTPDDWYLI